LFDFVAIKVDFFISLKLDDFDVVQERDPNDQYDSHVFRYPGDLVFDGSKQVCSGRVNRK